MTTQVGAKGKVVQVLGAVVDVEFPPDQLPEIYNELLVRPLGAETDLALEVEQHLGNNWVRCVAMGPTDPLWKTRLQMLRSLRLALKLWISSAPS